MARKAENRKTYNNVPMDYFVQKCRSIEQGGLNLSLKSENPEADGSVWFRIHHGMTAMSYGEKITITLRPLGQGTDVHVLSECGMPTQLVDGGKNKSNCAVIFRYLEANMPAAAPQGVVPPINPAAPQAPSQGTVQQDYVFCMQCGTRNSRAANFCMNCGSKLMLPN